MKIAEGLVELAAHIRWLTSHALSFIDPETQKLYPADFAAAEKALAALSKPMADAERLTDLPPEVFDVLCDGVLNLLVAEAILGESPASMHQFLRQASLNGHRDPQQTHLLAVRWLSNAGVIDSEALQAVIFGSPQMTASADGGSRGATPVGSSAAGLLSNGTTPSDAVLQTPESERYPTNGGTPQRFETTLELQGAIAGHLASVEPFFLGAHVTVLRGLIARYTDEVTCVGDVVAHMDVVTRPPPNEDGSPSLPSPAQGSYVPLIPDPRVIDDALLAWIHAVLSIVGPNGASPSALASPTSGAGNRHPSQNTSQHDASGAAQLIDVSTIEDLYLHTNDGRVLALLIHYYRPTLLPLSSIHLLHPLTVWQRQDNWSTIIHAAEQMDLWVGVFPAEFVSFGFGALQHHVLRFVAELFVMLATDAETQYGAVAEAVAEAELDASSAWVNVTGISQSSLQPAHLRRSQLLMRGSYAGDCGVAEAARQQQQAEAAAAQEGSPEGAQPNAGGDSPRAKFTPLRTHPVEDGTFPARGTPGAAAVHQSLDAATTTEGSPAFEEPVPPPVQTLGAPGASSPLRQSFAGTRSSAVGTLAASADKSPGGESLGNNDADDADVGVGCSIVLTNMMLNGMAMPIHRKAPAAGVDESVIVTELDSAPAPSASSPVAPRVVDAETAARDAEAEIMRTSAGSVAPPADAAAPPRSKSPDMGAASSRRRSSPPQSQNGGVRSSFADLSRGRRAGAPMNPLVKSVAHLRAQRPITKNGAAMVTRSLAQGSVDAEGVEDLIAELAEMHEGPPVNPSAAVPKGLDANDVRLQNQALRSALERQRQQVLGIVDRLRKGLRRHDFGVLLDHVKRHGQGSAPSADAGPPAPPVPAPRNPEPTVESVAAGFTPALNVLAMLAAKEANDPAAYAAIPEPAVDPRRVQQQRQPPTPAPPQPTVVPRAPEPAPAVEPASPPTVEDLPVADEGEEAARRARAIAMLRQGRPRASVPGSAPSSQTPDPNLLSVQGHNGRGATAPEPADVAGQPPRSTAFDVNLGSSVGVRGGAGPQLSTAQLAKLKQRHADRRQQQRAEAAKPVRLPPVEDPSAVVGSTGDPEGQVGGAPSPAAPKPAARRRSVSNPARAPGAAATASSRNNKGHIVNALKHVCLPGAINKPSLDATVQIVEGDGCVDASHFVVLLKDEYNKQFRGLYQYRHGSESVTRVFGAGPLSIKVMPDAETMEGDGPNTGPLPSQPSRFFKFDTGAKKFAQLPSSYFNQMVDAITLPPRLRNNRPPL